MTDKENITKIMIGLPSLGTIRVETTVALCYMLANSSTHYILYTPVSCYIHESRNDIIRQAIKYDAKYVLFVDSDMIFPENALDTLVSRDVDIIGVNYNYKTYPSRFVTILDKTIPDSITEPFKCLVAGTGFMLIKTEIFKKLPEPWFFFNPSTTTSEMMGEDVWFCNLARINDFDIWVDPTIKVGHIGTVIF
jgi:hypothetical protein